MLNDIHPPPMDSDRDNVSENGHRSRLTPHINPQEPGRHHARYLGEPTQTEPLYEMPLEERSSDISLVLSLVALVFVIVLVGSIWWMLG